MSAYIVPREHIIYLVKAAQSLALFGDPKNFCYWHCGRWYEIAIFEDEITAGQILWDENIKSVQYHYGEHDVSKLPGPVGENFELTAEDFRFFVPPSFFRPVEILKACDAYMYQSCEHPDWPSSHAAGFLWRLIRLAYQNLPGYDEAEWGPPQRFVDYLREHREHKGGGE